MPIRVKPKRFYTKPAKLAKDAPSGSLAPFAHFM